VQNAKPECVIAAEFGSGFSALLETVRVTRLAPSVVHVKRVRGSVIKASIIARVSKSRFAQRVPARASLLTILHYSISDSHDLV